VEIIKNVQQSYISKLQTFARSLKTIEKDYISKMQDMYGEDAFKYDQSPEQSR
jgi:hypothetical protein